MKVVKNYKYLLFIIPLVIFIIYNVSVDNDVWFILNHGRYVLSSGFPTIEPFTIHEGLSFIMQQWLSAVLFWIIYHYIGSKGLFLFILLIGMIVIFYFYKLCKLLSNSNNLSIFLTLIFSIAIRNYIVARPQVFTFLILIMELYYLELYIKSGEKKKLFILPFLSLFLINLHSSMWIMQFAFILPFLINGLKIKKLSFSNYELKPLLIVFFVMFLIGFINPYGYKSVIYIFNSYGVSYINSFVAEMKPLSFNNLNCKIFILCLLFMILSFNYFKKRHIELRHILLLFGTIVLAFMNTKGLPYFYIVYFYVLSYYFSNLSIKKLFQIYKNKCLKSFIYGLKIGIYIMLVLTLFYIFYSAFKELNYENPLNETADIILSDGKDIDVRLYVGYDNGGYMEYRGIRTYIDQRAEVFLKKNNKKEDIMLEHVKMGYNGFDFDEFIKKYDFTHFIVYPNENFDIYLSENEDKYELLFEQYDDDTLLIKLYKTKRG